jgi:hypothetical protein
MTEQDFDADLDDDDNLDSGDSTDLEDLIISNYREDSVDYDEH